MLFLISLMTLLFLFTFDEKQGSMIAAEVLSSQLNISAISFSVIDSVCLAAFLYIVVCYYQVCLNIERSYKYLHNVEFTMSEMCQMNIDRESGNYLSAYPWLSNVSHFFYTYIVPTLVVALSAIRLMCLNYCSGKYLYLAINVVFLVTLALSSIIYIIDRIRLKFIISKRHNSKQSCKECAMGCYWQGCYVA